MAFSDRTQDYAYCLKSQFGEAASIPKRQKYFILTTHLREKKDSFILSAAGPGTDTYAKKLRHPQLPSITTSWHDQMRKMQMRQLQKVQSGDWSIAPSS